MSAVLTFEEYLTTEDCRSENGLEFHGGKKFLTKTPDIKAFFLCRFFLPELQDSSLRPIHLTEYFYFIR